MDTVHEMFLAFLAAVLLIYLILAMQFQSRLQPLILLLTIPLTLVGALIALFITRRGIDLSVGMGILTLVGIAVNNAIILIDTANRERAFGKTMTEALLASASIRLRPILLTSLTTIAALIPAAIGTTVGSRIFQPFAITVIGGMVSAVFGTLIVVPTLTAALTSSPDPKEGGDPSDSPSIAT